MVNLQLLTPDDLQPIMQRLETLEEKAALVDLLVEEWVNTNQAVRITGKDRKTLITERDRPGTVIRYKMEGKTGKKPVYLLSSLIAYNKLKRIPTTRESLLKVA